MVATVGVVVDDLLDSCMLESRVVECAFVVIGQNQCNRKSGLEFPSQEAIELIEKDHLFGGGLCVQVKPHQVEEEHCVAAEAKLRTIEREEGDGAGGVSGGVEVGGGNGGNDGIKVAGLVAHAKGEGLLWVLWLSLLL